MAKLALSSRLAGLLGSLLLAIPAASGAADKADISDTHPSSSKMSKEEEAPLSRDALFDSAPEARKEGGTTETLVEPLPLSKDALFADPPVTSGEPASAQTGSTAGTSKEDLFGEIPPPEVTKKASTKSDTATILSGSFQTEIARTTSDPKHWSKVLGRLELGAQGRIAPAIQWKISGRLDYNAAYDLFTFYQGQARDDQRAEFHVRETYLDFNAWDWDWRVGRQHIVWGEMVGMFIADVVSSKDMREFILPDFQVLRIPQWAVRSEYFKDDFHAELVWIPTPSYNEIGKPRDFTQPGAGSDFFPYPPIAPGPVPVINNDIEPDVRLKHSNFGVRLSQLHKGWDLSGFYYTSMNSSPTLYQTALNVFTPRHDRIWQLGGTLAKDLGDFVLKAEAVYTNGGRFNLLVPSPATEGVVKQNTVDWAVGLDFNPGSDTRINTQVFQRHFFNHNPNIIPEKSENGVSLLVSNSFADTWKAEALLVHSLNRSDWMLRPKVSWGYQQNSKVSVGLDIFSGPPTGLFGQYDAQDRVWAEVRYDF